MNCPRVCTVLAATVIAALPGVALAQFPPAPGSSSAPVQDRWPDPPKSPQADRAPAAQPAPKRRLEVIWAKDAARSETSVIAINGKSQWGAPKGMKLGLPLAALEKANGRPFKLSGFDAEGNAGVAGWEGGALGAIPGGCKIGM